ncbi:hypothetical protein P692DRAFT_20220276 [Suillus brevipes Sb2]|nr:hypothetical protein P692DRAFT_20220276 [Suillus brevipes Sb2]
MVQVYINLRIAIICLKIQNKRVYLALSDTFVSPSTWLAHSSLLCPALAGPADSGPSDCRRRDIQRRNDPMLFLPLFSTLHSLAPCCLQYRLLRRILCTKCTLGIIVHVLGMMLSSSP